MAGNKRIGRRLRPVYTSVVDDEELHENERMLRTTTANMSVCHLMTTQL